MNAVHERWLNEQALRRGTKAAGMLPRALLGLVVALHAGSALRPGGAGPWRLGRTVARAAVGEDEAFEMAARAAARAARPLSADDDDDDWELEPPAHSPSHEAPNSEWRDIRARLCAVGLATTGESDGVTQERAERWAAKCRGLGTRNAARRGRRLAAPQLVRDAAPAR